MIEKNFDIVINNENYNNFLTNFGFILSEKML